MRPPSSLVPVGAVIAAIGIHQPVVSIAVRLRRTTLVEGDFSASTEQRAYLLGVVALALAAWVLPKLLPRATLVAVALAAAAAAGDGVAAVRAWSIATGGPHALEAGDSGFLERAALDLLDRLESAGVLVIDPAAGLWLITVGAAVLLAGVVLALRPAAPSSARPPS